ncbi:hypothetical protein M406DRAFT_286933 [Cryphonectria parasitica EP155]|uniref:Protein kinase domain-containing protein n=1 Tax=Cryphonectria parasitica (strain ATCC 38755 / EP155) TaxID=660469 RepID=A0A9P4Y9H5_CRYP1|nr:uncharacterized protein M406DRAFT_286933 [Cryphonectria parasitica EP155]KAF3768910.1 hypothetical protein M406DRAFT_286933 [Cryphonectria parasitica EP155]
MDLSERTIRDVIHPTAILRPIDHDHDHPVRVQAQDTTQTAESSWEVSQLNPKNRIDSLDPPGSPLWMIDGCTALGMQFYAVPLFLGAIPPIRCDVCIDEVAAESPLIRKLLDLDTVFHTRDRARIQQQGVCSYILRALQIWSTRYGLDNVRDVYYNSPFGARIVFRDLPLNVRDVDIRVIGNDAFELRHCTASELAEMWNMKVEQLPPTLDILDLAFVRQLHDSVCVVRYKKDQECTGHREGVQEGQWVLKALMNTVKYMYHELRNLLSIPSHPSIVARPARLVVKKHKLNPNREIVVGFLLPFYPGGGLRDELPLLRINHQLQLRDQVRWAQDICSAILHIHFQGNTYYPDLRLDQIIFPAGEKRPILLDFEQRGVWVEFGPPEINAIEYIRILALDEEERSDDDLGFDGSWPPRKRFVEILDRLLPEWRRLTIGTTDYDNPPEGYNIPWLCLTRREQEYAEVYMLGRLLWCIFEGMSAPQKAAVWQSYQNEPDFEFPEFRRTPPELRSLIIQCTRGHRGQLSDHIIRKRSKVVLRDDSERKDGAEAKIRATARDFWVKEVGWAEEFVLEREKMIKEGRWEENAFGRPILQEIASALSTFQRKVL